MLMRLPMILGAGSLDVAAYYYPFSDTIGVLVRGCSGLSDTSAAREGLRSQSPQWENWKS